MKKTGKKILVCIDLSTESIDLIKSKTKNWDWSGVSEVILCHVFPKKVYADNFFLSSYPPADQQDSIKITVEGVLRDTGDAIFENSSGHIPKWSSLCLVSLNKKKAVAEYILSNSIDEVLIGTSEKHGIAGLFTSSFAEYMVGHSVCDLRVFKPEVLRE